MHPPHPLHPTLPARAALVALALLALVPTGRAQSGRRAPVSDTEDARLSTVRVGDGRLHPLLDLDLRNGDFVRGVYDDDAAGLRRVPAHVQLGLVYELARDADAAPTAWLMLRSSNGLHPPSSAERASPRIWYESNNSLGVAARFGGSAFGALTDTVKTSPNDASATTHEMSAALSLDGESGVGAVRPGVVATWRPKGGSGFYTQASIEPEWRIGGAGPSAPRLSLPVVVGVGWRGFYEPGSGHRVHGSAGLAWQAPLAIGSGRWSVRLEALALVRDAPLRALGGPRADHAAVVPYGTLSLSYAD